MKSDNQQEDPLQAQLKTLEMEWDNIKQSISRSDRRNLSTPAAVDNRLFQLHENSPKQLMSLLQHEISPFQDQIRDSDDDDRAAIEVIDDREVVFEYGGLKGRRLFEESEMDSDGGEGLDVAEELEVSREFSYKGSENEDENCNRLSGGSCVSSPPPVTVAVNHGGGGGGGVRRWMISMTWIGVVIMMFAFGIVAFKCKGEDEQFLVPT